MERLPNTELLALVASYLGTIEGRKRFQKIVFLLKEESAVQFTYPFTSYLYGPYSSRLQDDIDILVQTGNLQEEKAGSLFRYKITDLGRKNAHQIERTYRQHLAKDLRGHLKDLQQQDTEELVNRSKRIMNKKIKHNIFA